MAVRRQPVRDYQQTLAERRTSEDDAPGTSHLGMQLGDGYWLLDLADVSEVIPVPDVLTVPLTKPWYAGIANVRGSLVSVVDFSAFVGGMPVALGERARLVLVAEKHHINSALVFSRVVGLRQCERFEREPAEPHQPSWVAGCYRDHEQQRWNMLNMHALVTHPDFLQVELQFG